MRNFVKIGPSVADIWLRFDFFNMAAVHSLGFLSDIFGPPTESTWLSLSLRKNVAIIDVVSTI